MASSSTQPDPTTEPPARNSISHESADLLGENDEHWGMDLDLVHQPGLTTQPPASNGISHESADLPDKSNEHGGQDPVQEMETTIDEPPASNGVHHESADLPNEHSEDGSKDLSQEMDATVKKMKDAQNKIRKIKEDVAAMRESIGDIWEIINRMKQMVLTKPDSTDETST